MFTSSLLAKGGGLIVTIFIARYLDATALGVYAVVFSITLILELITPLGQQIALVRAIARNRFLMISQWVNASFIAVAVAISFFTITLVTVKLFNFDKAFSLALIVAIAGLPAAGLNLVAQAVLQGVEKMEYQPVAAFIGRVLGLLALWVSLEQGAGVWSAFLCRAIFQITSFAILSVAIYRHAQHKQFAINWCPSVAAIRKTLAISMPFAFQNLLNEGLLRLHIIILPFLIAFDAVGQFNAANQITLTGSTIIPIVMLTVLPVFSRAFEKNNSDMSQLSDQTLKFLLIIIIPFAFIVTVFAQQIIMIIFGAGYDSAIPVLQIVIWSQVFVAADSVMLQNMIASDNEIYMVRRTAIGVFVNLTLTVIFGIFYGIIGIAVAVVLSRGILLFINTYFVTKNICRPNIIQSVFKPSICAILSSCIGFALLGLNLFLAITVAIGLYILFLVVFKTINNQELSAIRQLIIRYFY